MSLPSSQSLGNASGSEYNLEVEAIREGFFNKPQAVQGRILRYPKDFLPLCLTEGQIYIRDDYREMYQKMKKMSTTYPGSVLAIDGQPGTGKTRSLYAFMAYRLAEGKPAILATSSTAWDISSAGVRHIGHAGLQVLQPDRNSPQWLFIDNDSTNISLPVDRLDFFTIVTTSPHSERYRTALRRRGGVVWLVKKWEEEELLECLKINGLYSSWAAGKSLDDIQKAVTDSIRCWGSAPKDVAKDLFYGHEIVWQEITATLESLDASKLLQSAQGFWRNSSDIDHTISHQLISYYRSKGCESQINKHDVRDIEIKSFPICQATQKKLRVFGYQQALDFLWLCHYSSGSHMLAGWSFESLAIAALRRGVPHRGPLSDAHPMEAVSIAQRRIARSALSAPHGISSDSITPSMSTSWLSRETRCYPNDFRNVDLSSNHLYVPENSNNPFFDAFVVSVDDVVRVILVSVLQMTIAEQHLGSAKGYKLLQKLKRHLLGLWQNENLKTGRKQRRTDEEDATVKFEYFLVVPRRLESGWSSSGNNELRWTLPHALPSGLEGDFFVQEIPVQSPIVLDLVEEDESEYDYAGSEHDPDV